MRKERTLKARHGEKILTAKQIKKPNTKSNRLLYVVADAYFDQRGSSQQAAKYDRYRYAKHVSPTLGKKPVTSISVLDIQRIRSQMADKAPATVWGALELVLRISTMAKKPD